MLWHANLPLAVLLVAAMALSGCSANLEAESLSAKARVGQGAATAPLDDSKPCESLSSIDNPALV